MLRALFERFGYLPLTLGLTTAVVLVSIGVTLVVTGLLGEAAGPTGLAIAVIVPGLITPVFTVLVLRLLSQLWQAEASLKILAVTDELTQANNRRRFLELAAHELERAERYQTVFSISLFDLDNFKAINDTYGHRAGDDVLRQVGAVSRVALRAGDTFARYGGEEFGVLLEAADAEAARCVIDRLRARLAETVVLSGGRAIRCTVSAGLVTCDLRLGAAPVPDGPPTLDQLLERADAALYSAKAAGGNAVVAA